MATPVNQFRQLTIFGSPNVTHILKNPSSDYETIDNKEWEKNIIKKFGLTKQDTCKNTQVIYGTLKSKPETERTEAISAYLHHKLNLKQLFPKVFFNPQTTSINTDRSKPTVPKQRYNWGCKTPEKPTTGQAETKSISTPCRKLCNTADWDKYNLQMKCFFHWNSCHNYEWLQ